MRQVLIAHQSTIPHYRVAFFNALEEQKPDDWSFRVSFDETEFMKPRFFKEFLDVDSFNFPIYPVSTLSLDIGSNRISYQTMWREAGRCDLVVVENAINNLVYPLSQLHMLHRTKVAFWGHGRDVKATKPGLVKGLSEWVKLNILLKYATGFFAYTPGVKEYLVGQGLAPNRIFVVNNTIDINKQRANYNKWLPERERIRSQHNLLNKRVLLFVGRVNRKKRVDFLLESFAILYERNKSFHLILVGEGVEIASGLPGVSCYQSADDLEIIPLYLTSDVFTFPGSVGLGPLQALCYDLPVITIASDAQNPEFEYLSKDNSIILGPSATPGDYADNIENLFGEHHLLGAMKPKIWPSIQNLTIEAMANNFIAGVNKLLEM